MRCDEYFRKRSILYTLYYRENCTQKDICDVWNLAKQTVSTQCNELLDQGQINIVRPLQNSPKSPKFPPRHLGDFGEFCKGLGWN